MKPRRLILALAAIIAVAVAAVPSRDLLWIGVPLIIGCAVVTLTGPLVLRVFGFP